MERWDPAVRDSSGDMEGRGEMTKTPVRLQDLRRRIYAKAKAAPSWRFWGLFVHVCKMETLREAYALAKKNDGAPGVDGVTFEAIEAGGVESFLERLRDELVTQGYRPLRNRRKEIPKDGGKKVRVLGIPAIRDRVVQGALRLILEPIFEADFQPGSYGYRPKRTAGEAVERVSEAIVRGLTRVIDIDLRSYFDHVKHHILMAKLARRISDGEVLRLLKMILKATGNMGVPQGGVISPLLSNIYLNDVDRMLGHGEVVHGGQVPRHEHEVEHREGAGGPGKAAAEPQQRGVAQEGADHPSRHAVKQQGRHGEHQEHVLHHVRAEEVVVGEIVDGAGQRDEEHRERAGEGQRLMRGDAAFGIQAPPEEQRGAVRRPRHRDARHHAGVGVPGRPVESPGRQRRRAAGPGHSMGHPSAGAAAV